MSRAGQTPERAMKVALAPLSFLLLTALVGAGRVVEQRGSSDRVQPGGRSVHHLGDATTAGDIERERPDVDPGLEG